MTSPGTRRRASLRLLRGRGNGCGSTAFDRRAAVPAAAAWPAPGRSSDSTRPARSTRCGWDIRAPVAPGLRARQHCHATHPGQGLRTGLRSLILRTHQQRSRSSPGLLPRASQEAGQKVLPGGHELHNLARTTRDGACVRAWNEPGTVAQRISPGIPGPPTGGWGCVGCATRSCALSSAEEHFLHTEGVAGSNPAARTIFNSLIFNLK